MVEALIICKKLGVLVTYYQELQELVLGMTLDTYRTELFKKRAVEREIQLIVECATDINNMILKMIDKQPSKDYFNSFIDLAENNVISVEFALQIAPSTGLRNILVHEYQKIDDTIVFYSINNVLVYYKHYITKVSTFLDCGI